MKKKAVLAGGALVGALALMPALSASAAGVFIANGDFETDAVGSTTVTGWTFLNQQIDLGASSIAGCVTSDTSDYSQLPDIADAQFALPAYPVPVDGDDVLLDADGGPVWVDQTGTVVPVDDATGIPVYYGLVESDWDGSSWTDYYIVVDGDAYRVGDVAGALAEGDTTFADGFATNVLADYTAVPDPTVRQDNVPAMTDTYFWDAESEFSSRTVDADTASIDPNSTKALELSSNMNGASDSSYGYVVHGPAAFSEEFTTTSARTVSLDWLATGASDDYHVLGYVLNTATCQQTEVIDSTGHSSSWETASVTLPAAGTYRFVFVSGTYDASWGGAAGALMYVDDIRITPVFTGTGIDLEPLFADGDPVANAPIQLSGGGLQPGSAWTAELHSTPVTLASGVADSSGNFWLLSSLPATVDPGKHEIVLTGIAPDGSTITDRAYITVGATGVIGYLSLSGPEGETTTTAGGVTTPNANLLAETGVDALPFLLAGGGLVAFGAAALVFLRRKARRQEV